ncbi:MAG: hypothetical protein HYV27_07765 [Candidatus Hydrogenedentes bacterium]|nr:hypothetical protein [Candidatus Hydrogenedentota bacterium]
MHIAPLLTLAAVAAASIPAWGAPDAPVEITAVENCYRNHKTAIAHKDGESALALASSASLKYFGELLELALHGTKEDLFEHSLADKYLILSIRHRAPADKVRELDGATLYQMSVDRGWLGEATTLDREIGTVEVDGATAHGAQVLGGERTGGLFHFVKEDGVWRIELAYQLEIVETMLRSALKESQIPEESFFVQILGVATNKPVNPAVWEPLAAPRTGTVP